MKVFADASWEGKHRPTSEYHIHHLVQMQHPEINAVIHAHSPALVTISTLHKVPDTMLTLGSWKILGKVGMAEYQMPGSMALAECVAASFNEGYRAVILKNHAAFLGTEGDLQEGFGKFEQLDWISELSILSWGSGCARSLTPETAEAFDKGMKVYLPDLQQNRREVDELRARIELTHFSRRAYDRKLFTSSFEGMRRAEIIENEC